MANAQTNPVRVVVIDDVQVIREVLELAVARAPDFDHVGEAADAEAGIALVEAVKPDLVLLDIAMPRMDGLQALPLIRAALPGVIVVMLSGFSEDSAALSAVQLGAHGYIRKGVGIPELLDQLREIVEVRLQIRDRTRGE